MTTPSRRHHRADARLARRTGVSLDHWAPQHGDPAQRSDKRHASIDCGWGHLLLAQTYDDAGSVARDLEAYERFLKDKLTRLDNVASIETSFALGQVKRSEILPLD